MAIFEDRLDSFFSEDLVQTWELFFKTIMETDLPKVDMQKGSVIYDILIRPSAVFHGLTLFNINRMRRSMSLREIVVEPTIADTSSVDDLLSNFGLVRKGGTKATGNVTIFLSNNNTTSIPSGAVFSSGTLNFITQVSFVGVPDGSLISKETDRFRLSRHCFRLKQWWLRNREIWFTSKCRHIWDTKLAKAGLVPVSLPSLDQEPPFVAANGETTFSDLFS